MPYFNQFGLGPKEDPTVETPYFVNWRNDIILPPPGSDLMILESGEYMISEAANDYMITE